MSTPTTNPNPPRRNWAWAWLAYTGFLFIDPIFDPSLYRWIGTLTVFGLFLIIFRCYIRVTDQQRSLRFWWIAATFLLGLITFPWNPGATTFFTYTAAFLPFSVRSVRRVLALFAAEAAIILAEGYIFSTHGSRFHISWPNALVAVFLMLIIGCGNIFFAEQKRADCRLRASEAENRQLAAVAERERIARDLHDVLGHTLSVIVLKAELAKRLIQEGPSQNIQLAAREIADVEFTARTALTEVREAIGGYRTQGLTAELAHARQTLDSAGVTLLWQPPPTSAPPLTATEETVLSLSVREAVTNIVRHAEATRCTMSLAPTSEGFHALLVEDDGPHPVQQEGNGLRGMRERVTSLGGRLSIHSEQGTRLLIELPITATRQGNPA
jgi:two-component system sensor histidine kinase DesK